MKTVARAARYLMGAECSARRGEPEPGQFTLLGSRCSVSVQVRFGLRGSGFGSGFGFAFAVRFAVHGSAFWFVRGSRLAFDGDGRSAAERSEGRRARAARELNLNTNRAARTKKREWSLPHEYPPIGMNRLAG